MPFNGNNRPDFPDEDLYGMGEDDAQDNIVLPKRFMKITNRKLSTTPKPKMLPRNPPSGRVKLVDAVIDDIEDGLPLKKTTGRFSPLMLKYLFIGPPGFGKTQFFGSFPDTLLLCCEEGHMFTECFKIIIDCFDYKQRSVPEPWDDEAGNKHMSFIQAVDLIEESTRFKFIVIDTVDALVKMIQDFFVVSKKVDHISDLGDYGKGFDMGQNAPYRRATGRILKSGRGIGLITHQEIVESQFKGGKRAKKVTSLPAGITKQLIPQMDIVLSGEFGKKHKPNKFKDRIVITEGSDEAIAKNRGGLLPATFILPNTDAWTFFEQLFLDPKKADAATKHYEKLYEQ